MSASPLISVIVPFFNRQRYLDACAEALLSQVDVGGPVEIILVDNGSADEGRALLEKYPGLIVLHEPRRGAYAARNTGLRRAAAPLIAFTDADCVVDPDWLAAIRRRMQNPAVAVIVGSSRYPRSASLALKLLGAYENAKADFVSSRCPPAYRFAYANNMAVRRSVFDEIGPFEEWDRAADTELVHRLAARRPDLTMAFDPAMRVTHLEFLRVRDRVRRLSLYTRTNSQIRTFRELSLAQRLGVVAHLVRRPDV